MGHLDVGAQFGAGGSGLILPKQNQPQSDSRKKDCCKAGNSGPVFIGERGFARQENANSILRALLFLCAIIFGPLAFALLVRGR